MLRKPFYLVLALLVLSAAGGWLYLANVNNYQADGERELAMLDAPVRVIRAGQPG